MPIGNIRQAGQGNSPGDWWGTLPPVIKLFGAACAVTTTAASFGLLPYPLILLSWTRILRRLEVWRLITPFFILGKLDFHFLMLLVYIIQYGVKLEQEVYRNRTPDFVWMMLFSMAALLGTTVVLPRLMLGPQMIMVLVYLWSRAYPTANISFMGVVTLQAFYLPLVFVVMSLCMGGDWLGELMGVLVGHLYYFLTELHPAAGGRQLLRTPNWLKRQVLAAGFGQVDVREVQMANPADPRFRAFAGQGRRLAD